MDKDYTYTIEVNSIIHTSGLEGYPELKTIFANKAKDIIVNQKEWTAACWWELDSQDQWHEALLNFTEDDIVVAKFTYTVTCNETKLKTDSIEGEIELPLQMDYSSFEIKVNSLSTLDTILIF